MLWRPQRFAFDSECFNGRLRPCRGTGPLSGGQRREVCVAVADLAVSVLNSLLEPRSKVMSSS